jgi:hypothetical protein
MSHQVGGGLWEILILLSVVTKVSLHSLTFFENLVRPFLSISRGFGAIVEGMSSEIVLNH